MLANVEPFHAKVLEPGESFASCEIQVPSQDVIMSMLFFLP